MSLKINKAFGIRIVLLYGLVNQARTVDDQCITLPSCTSKECIHYTKLLYNNIKPDADPCNDFYEFSCKGYADRFEKEDTQTVHDDMWLSLQKTIKDLLDNLKPDGNIASEKMKKMYDTCTDIESSELKSVPDALQFLTEIGIPGWPELNENFEFTVPNSEVLGKLAAYGEFAFIKIQSSPYKENNIESSNPSIALILPDNYIFDSKLKHKDIDNSILMILKYFKFEQNAAYNMLENFKAIENIGIKLQNETSENSRKCRDDTKKGYMKLNCSEERLGNLKVLCSFWRFASNTGNLRNFVNDIVHISCRWNQYYYLENIFSNLANFTPKSIADYLALRFFFSHLDDLNLYFRLIKKTYSGIKDSKHKTKHLINRWQYCIGWIIKSMRFALGYEYTSNIITEPEQKEIFTIIQDYIQELISILENQNWINKRARTFFKNQIRKLKPGIKATMKKYKNETLASNYYKEFKTTEDSFLKNILEYKRSFMHKLVNIDTSFNSFYGTSDSDTLDFGFSLFFPPAYSHGLPRVLNYAMIGWIISHELIHNLQLLFDLGPIGSETEIKFLNKTGCYTTKYLQVVERRTGNKVLSTETKEEIIADNIAWELTERIIQKKFNLTDELQLLNFKYTPQQLIYLSFAQVCCAAMNTNIEDELYRTRPHDLQNLRVRTVLQNSRPFSRTFECLPDSPMNPQKKCIFFE